MRIATWNVNGLRARLEFVVLWLRQHSPDVVLLQELRVDDAGVPAQVLADEGYYTAAHGQPGRNGVAILSRTPLDTVARGIRGLDQDGARVIAAGAGGLRFVSVYVPNGQSVSHPDFQRKLEWLDDLTDHVAAVDPGSGLVIGGDFNIAPTGLDTWDEERHRGHLFHTEAERARFRRLADLGLVDAFRAQHPDLQAFSWWDYRAGAFHKNRGLRIDFLLVAADVGVRATEVFIDREARKKRGDLIPSDHAPVVLDLGPPGRPALGP